MTAAFTLANVPLTVIEELPFNPFVTVRPLVDASVNVPSVTVKVSVSALLPANESANEMAVPWADEKTREEFVFNDNEPGTVTVGALGAWPLRYWVLAPRERTALPP